MSGADLGATANDGAAEEGELQTPATEEMPLPLFLHRRRRGLHRSAKMAAPLEVTGGPGPRGTKQGDSEMVGEASTPSNRDSEDPWLQGDPWQHVHQTHQKSEGVTQDPWRAPADRRFGAIVEPGGGQAPASQAVYAGS